MHKKIIFQGKLVFSSESSYQKIKDLYVYRVENFYRGDVLLEADEVWQVDSLSLTIGRKVMNGLEKSWNHTILLLEYCAQFAITGHVGCWLLDDNGLKKYKEIVPTSDRIVVQQYLQSLALIEEGRSEDAVEELTEVIAKYDKHALAYERRGYVNAQMKKYHDAKRDFTKAIKIDDSIPHAYYARARILKMEGDFLAAIDDLDLTTKKALALQPVYWLARRLKAECHIERGEYSLAEFDLKFLTARKFKGDDPNYRYLRFDNYLYARVLKELDRLDDAYATLQKALKHPEDKGHIPEDELLYLRGILQQNAGKKGFLKDLEASAALGHSKAKKALEAAV